MVFNLEYITNFIDKKIEENEDIIIVKYFELKIQEGLTEEQIEYFLEKSKQRLMNLGYQIYATGDECTINNQTITIENNIYYIAIKDK